MTVAPSRWSIALPSGCEIGEHPVWDSRSGTVVWVDITAGTVHRATPPTDDDAESAWDDTGSVVGAVVGAAALRRDGGLVVASDGHLLLLDAHARPDADPVDLEVPNGARFNDMACDPAGSLVVGTTTGSGTTPDGLLWSVSAASDVRVLIEGVTESNGLDWSLDGTVLYYVDSGEPVVRRYAYDASTSQLGVRLPDLVTVEDGSGVPDGLVVDASGTVWVALWEGGALRRYSPDGDLLAHLDVPVSRPTCPAFVGPGLDRLVLTSGWEGMTADERAADPWAGHLLTTVVDARGREPHRYAGGPR